MQLPIEEKKRQVIDVKITPIVIDHHIQSKICPVCGKKTTADHPKGVDHYIQYGNTFSAIMICLNKGNYVPYERLSYISKDIFGLNVSSGTLVNIMHECGKSLDEIGRAHV